MQACSELERFYPPRPLPAREGSICSRKARVAPTGIHEGLGGVWEGLPLLPARLTELPLWFQRLSAGAKHTQIKLDFRPALL